MLKKLRIGTRASKLALAQVQIFEQALRARTVSIELEIVKIQTTGDKRQDRLRNDTWDKKDWILEIEQALLDEKIDLALHSAKDVPLEIEEGTSVCSVLKRAVVNDVLISKQGEASSLVSLADKSVLATSSLRRASQVLSLNSSLKVVPLRGNVPTRIKKLKESAEIDYIILAAAGLARLEIEFRDQLLSFSEMLPAVNQGILAGQFLSKRADVSDLLSSLSDKDTENCFLAEREFIKVIGADCHSSVAVLAEVFSSKLNLRARVLAKDGNQQIEDSIDSDNLSAKELGANLAKQLILRGASSLLE